MENIGDIETFLDSVSGSDAVLSSVSGGDAYYINVYVLPEPTQEPEVKEVFYTVWDKPLENYTVTESLLLVLVVIVLVVLVWVIIRGGFKWQN